MKIYKDVPIPEPHAESKTAFVREMQVGNSVLCSGGFHGKEVRRITSAMRNAGFKATSRTESGHGKKAKIRVWRIEGSATRVRTAKSRKVGKHTKAGHAGKIIECPECGNLSVSYHFSWSTSTCLGCRAEIEKTDYLLPKLGKRKEAKVRAACESDNRVRQFCATKLRPLWNGDDYDGAFGTLYDLLNKSGVAAEIGKMSDEAIEELAQNTDSLKLPKQRGGKTNEHSTK